MYICRLPQSIVEDWVLYEIFMVISATCLLGCSPSNKPTIVDEDTEKHRALNIAAYGNNILVIYPGADRLNCNQQAPSPMTIQDINDIAKRCPSVVAVSPIVTARCQVISNDLKWIPASLLGTNDSYLQVRGWGKLEEGRNFSKKDVSEAKAVCLIGRTIVDNIFNGTVPLGKQIKINGNSFRVIGILTIKGKDALGRDKDDIILTPWTSATKYCDAKAKGFSSIWVKAASEEDVSDAKKDIIQVLRDNHHTTPSGQNDFTIVDLIESQDVISRCPGPGRLDNRREGE